MHGWAGRTSHLPVGRPMVRARGDLRPCQPAAVPGILSTCLWTPSTARGWSVLAVGRSEVVYDPDFARKVHEAGLEPFVDGQKPAIVCIAVRRSVGDGRRYPHPPSLAKRPRSRR